MSLRKSQDALIETSIEILDSLTEQLREKNLSIYAELINQCHDEIAAAYIADRRRRVEILTQLSA